MKASEALNQMYHTYQRLFDETIYTIEDIRFPEYNGKQISRKLIKGKHVCEWIQRRDNNDKKKQA